jgi:hypothetical protein
MYVYPRTVSINYSLGGAANMVLNCDTVRRRPMLRTEVEVVDQTTKEKKKTTVYKSIPNLVYKWTNGPTTSATTKPDSDPTGDTVTPYTADLSDEKKKLRAWKSQRLGSLFEVEADTPVKSWRVQNGDFGAFSPKSPHPDLKLNKTKRGIVADAKYLNLIRSIQPYTDEKGYELIGPFPWGRWFSLEEAITKFAENGYLGDGPKDEIVTRLTDSGSAFVFAGLGTPKGLTQGQLDALSSTAEDISSPYLNSFELTYDSPEAQKKTPVNPDAKKAIDPAADATAQKEQSFLDKVDSMLDAFHSFANPTPTGSQRFRYRGRLGSLVNDTGFHPLTETLGNSDLATNWSEAATDWANSLGSKWIS